jgi:cell wall-associated NlpC family hydrolase
VVILLGTVIRDALLKVGFSSDQVKAIISNLIATTDKQKVSTDSAADAQRQYAEDLKKTIELEMEKATIEEKIVGTTQGRIDQTKDQITAYQLLSNVESLSVDQKAALADATAYLNALYPQFIENGKLNVEQMRKEAEAEDILLKAVTDVANGHADAEEIMTLNQAQQARNRLQIMSAEITALQQLAKTYEETSKHQLEMAQATKDDRAFFQAEKFYRAQTNTQDSIAKTKSELDKLIPSYDSLTQKLADATGYQGQYYNAVDKSNDKSKDSIYVTDKYKQSLESLNAQISKMQELQKKYASDSSQYRSALQKEIDLQTQKLKLMQAQEKSLDQQIKSGKIVQTGMITTSSPTTTTTSTSGSYNWNSLGGKLAGSGSLMEKYGNMYGVSPALLAAIAMHETGNGTSSALRNKNNAFGIMGSNGLKSFTSLEESIKYAASLLKRNYIDKGLTTVKAIQKKYAPVGVANDPTGLNKNWVNGVNNFLSAIGGITKSVSSSSSNSGGISALIAEARRQSNLGTFTYKQIGGEFKGTYQQFLDRALSDCSQFVQEYFQNFLNTNVPRTAAEQWNAGQAVAKGQQQIGDLVFWNTTGKAHSHVGIYTGNGKVMQMGTKGLKEISVDAIKNFEGYRRITGTGTPTPSSVSTDTANVAQAVDQAKSDLLDIQTDIASTQSLIQQLQEQIVQSKIDEVVNKYEKTLSNLDVAISNSQGVQQQYKEGSRDWLFLANQQIGFTKMKIDTTNQEIAAVKNLIKTEKLSVSQKAALNQKLIDLNSSQIEYLNTIDQIYDKEREVQTQAKEDAVQKLYDGEIKKLQDKLDKLDEIEKKENRITQQKELQDKIDKAKSDKSHQYIDSNGNVQLTYDKGAVADLEKEMADLKDGWAKEDAKQSLQDQIAALETKRDDSIAALQKLNEDYQTKAFKNTTDLTNTMNQFIKDLAKIYGTSIQLPKHHKGDIVGTQSSSLGNLINKLFNVGSNEQVIKALKGEVVINPNLPNVQNNFKNLVDVMSSGRQSVGAVDQSKHIIIQNMTVKANNPLEFFQGLDNALRSQ